jgi:hypothetical protein
MAAQLGGEMTEIDEVLSQQLAKGPNARTTLPARRRILAHRRAHGADLRVVTAEEGGAERVGGDLFCPTIDCIADWVAEVLQ